MTFQSLLIHTANVLVLSKVNTTGRIINTWTNVGTIRCRFTQYSPSRLFVNNAAAENKIDAVVFASSDFLTLSQGKLIRLETTDSGWSGKYEMKIPARIVNDKDSVHHVEITVVRVSE